MNTLLIEKQTGGYFKFTLNGDTANAITSINNDLLAVGNQLHFKTGNGANIIKEQFIYPADVTIVSGGTFTFTTVAQVWDKLIAIDYFAWLGGGGTGGVDRFDDLLDTFSYTGNAGKAVVVDNSELKLVPITLYNKRLFTELEDTPNSLVPDKMVVVNPAGTALIFQDQPEPPAEYLNSVGYFDYNDLATQTTPLNAVANVALKLTNDTEGANTSTDQNPYGVSYVWDYVTNQFNFSELEVGDTIDVRVHVQITTTTSNQKVSLSAKFGIGSVAEFTNSIFETTFKSSGLHEISFVAPFYMGSTYITDYPAELYLTTDASATVKVDGWYVRILRKNINIITVDYQVEDATTTTKGIVRLAGDLGGTANSPTVPELANKVPTSRTVSTTSPLLGGGALSSNLTLSIQQANSIQSGFVTFADWNRFDEAHNDRIVSAAVTGTTTKTLTLNQHDGGTITANWTDNNTDAVTSVFGRTGAVVAANGDYTTTQVTEGTNLYYTEARVDANTNVSANTAARHSVVTIGTANGLSLSGQALSLALASTSANGALSSTDWNTFNGKQAALSGTGFVKISGTTISYDNNTYALDSAVVKLTGDQSITGGKSFTTNTAAPTVVVTNNSTSSGLLLQNTSTGRGATSNNVSTGTGFYSDNTSTGIGIYSNNSHTGYGIRSANTSDGTGLYLTNSSSGTGIYSNNSSTGNGIESINSSSGFGISSSNTGSGRGIYSSNNSTGDAINIANSGTGRGIYLTNASSGKSLVLNNDAAATGMPFTISKNGTDKFTINDAGEATGTKFIKSGGTSSQFLMADGSVSTGSGGTVTGTGTQNTLPKFTGASTLGNSTITDNLTFIGMLNGRQGLTLGANSDGVTLTDNTNKRARINVPQYGTTTGLPIGIIQGNASVSSNTIIIGGIQSGYSLAADSIEFYIGATYNATTANQIARFFSTGNLLLQNGGTFTDAGFRLDVNGTARVQGALTTTADAVVNGVNIGLGGGAIATNTRVGASALNANTTGTNNSALGNQSLISNTTGGFNTALGAGSLRLNTTGSVNTAVGAEALYNNTTGGQNTAIGAGVLFNNTTGGNNSALGRNAGRYIADGTTGNVISNNSIFIGFGTKALANNQTNQIVIGYNTVGLGSNTTVLGNSSTTTTAIYGNVGIGTTSPSEKLEVVTSGAYTTIYTGANGNGASGLASSSDNRANTWFVGSRKDSIGGASGTDRFNILYNTNSILTATTGGNVGIGTTTDAGYKLDVNGNVRATGFFNSSDIRLKDLIDYDYNVSDIKPITYLWKDGRDNKKHVGYSAQQVQKVMPDAVNEDDKGFLSVNYVEVLVAQVNFLTKRIEELEKIVSK